MSQLVALLSIGTLRPNAPNLQGLTRVRKKETHSFPPSQSELSADPLNLIRRPVLPDYCRGHSFRHPQTSLREIHLEGLLLFQPRYPVHIRPLQLGNKDRWLGGVFVFVFVIGFIGSNRSVFLGGRHQMDRLVPLLLLARYCLCRTLVPGS